MSSTQHIQRKKSPSTVSSFPIFATMATTKEGAKDAVDALLDAHPMQFVHGIDGETLCYRDFPASEPTPDELCLVVLPGYAGSGDVLAADLAIHLTDHRLIGVNPRGWMDSTLNREIYDHQQNARDVMELLERVGVYTDEVGGKCGKVMVLGHSSGGCPAAYMALMFPERVSGCFLYDSIPLHGQRYFPMLSSSGAPIFKDAVTKEDFIENTKGLTALGAHSPDESTCRTFWDGVCGGGDWMPPLGSPAMHRFHEACQKHRSRSGCHMGNATFNVTPIKTVSSPPTEWLQKLECPMIVLHGSKDVLCPTNVMKAMSDLAVSERWAAGEDGVEGGLISYYEIEDAGHFAFIEKPTEFIAAYRQALTEKVLA